MDKNWFEIKYFEQIYFFFLEPKDKEHNGSKESFSFRVAQRCY